MLRVTLAFVFLLLAGLWSASEAQSVHDHTPSRGYLRGEQSPMRMPGNQPAYLQPGGDRRGAGRVQNMGGNRGSIRQHAKLPSGQNLRAHGRLQVLSKLESILSYISNGVLMIGCGVGVPAMLFGFIQMATGASDGIVKVLLGLSGIVGGLATPYCVNWLFNFAVDNSLF